MLWQDDSLAVWLCMLLLVLGRLVDPTHDSSPLANTCLFVLCLSNSGLNLPRLLVSHIWQLSGHEGRKTKPAKTIAAPLCDQIVLVQIWWGVWGAQGGQPTKKKGA